MTRHLYGTCHDEDCPACEKRSQERAEDYEADPYGWQADEAAEREAGRFERWAS